MITAGIWRYAWISRLNSAMVITTQPFPPIHKIERDIADNVRTEDDARLISAAPELLAALKRLTYACQANPRSENAYSDEIRQAYNAMIKAYGSEHFMTPQCKKPQTNVTSKSSTVDAELELSR